MRPQPRYKGDLFVEAYDEGLAAARAGKLLADCPYKESKHERDTTLEDWQVYYWELGFDDFVNPGDTP